MLSEAQQKRLSVAVEVLYLVEHLVAPSAALEDWQGQVWEQLLASSLAEQEVDCKGSVQPRALLKAGFSEASQALVQKPTSTESFLLHVN